MSPRRKCVEPHVVKLRRDAVNKVAALAGQERHPYTGHEENI